MENKYWKETIAALIAGIWVYTLADIAGGFFGVINNIVGAGEAANAFMNGGSAGGFGFLDIICLLCNILVILGYFFFFRSLFRFIKMQRNDADRANANKIKTSYILLIIGIVVGWIPFIGWIAGPVLLIISYVQQLLGYGGLSKSEVLPQNAKEGAAKIRTAIIWMLVGSVLGIIPLVGGFIELVITIVMFFYILKGWKLIYLGAPAISEAEAEEYAKEDALPKSKLDIIWNNLAKKITKEA